MRSTVTVLALALHLAACSGATPAGTPGDDDNVSNGDSESYRPTRERIGIVTRGA
jgi:hypothetical protein